MPPDISKPEAVEMTAFGRVWRLEVRRITFGNADGAPMTVEDITVRVDGVPVTGHVQVVQ